MAGLRGEASDLKKVAAEQPLDLPLLKIGMIGDGAELESDTQSQRILG
jgi:hypothetical protein